ncbi:MAG: hypothetical protein J6A59_13750 [Lachnospiraceae bacterium]|nr:hypothetical protein [Lachnospiraceae bacterium]
MSIDNIIRGINSNTNIKNPIHFYLNGGCYIFAKKLQEIIGGNLRYLTLEHHFVLEHNNKLYDTTGNVTNSYINSKYITELEFNSREKLRNSVRR